jgi:hypothetical protein
VKGTKTQTSKKEGKEFKNPATTGSMRRYSGEYLGRESASERKMIARFLDVERENRYWMERGERRCSYCSCA